MQLKSTFIPKIAVYLMTFTMLAICFILFPELIREEAAGKPNVQPAYPFLVGLWLVCIPIFVGLHQTFKLLTYVDTNTAFSSKAVQALRNIKISALIFAVLIILGVLAIGIGARQVNPPEDVTGFFTLGFIFTFIASVIAIFVGVLQKLLQNAIDMKAENDFTV